MEGRMVSAAVAAAAVPQIRCYGTVTVESKEKETAAWSEAQTEIWSNKMRVPARSH